LYNILQISNILFLFANLLFYRGCTLTLNIDLVPTT